MHRIGSDGADMDRVLARRGGQSEQAPIAHSTYTPRRPGIRDRESIDRQSQRHSSLLGRVVSSLSFFFLSCPPFIRRSSHRMGHAANKRIRARDRRDGVAACMPQLGFVGKRGLASEKRTNKYIYIKTHQFIYKIELARTPSFEEYTLRQVSREGHRR
jgi:hypothetical protein